MTAALPSSYSRSVTESSGAAPAADPQCEQNAAMYADVRGRIAALVRDLPETELASVVPGTPAWTVRDLVCHLAGVAADVVEGNMKGAPGDTWTDAQVVTRRATPIGSVLDEWDRHAAAIEDRLRADPRNAFLLLDVTTHEQDLRGALRRRGGEESSAFDTTLQGMVGWLGARLQQADAPALRILSGQHEWEIGKGEPAATVTVPDRVELFRFVSGRRSADQVRSYEWDGDPEPFLPHINPFGAPRTDDVLG